MDRQRIVESFHKKRCRAKSKFDNVSLAIAVQVAYAYKRWHAPRIC